VSGPSLELKRNFVDAPCRGSAQIQFSTSGSLLIPIFDLYDPRYVDLGTIISKFMVISDHFQLIAGECPLNLKPAEYREAHGAKYTSIVRYCLQTLRVGRCQVRVKG
jgi:hypothetical protein